MAAPTAGTDGCRLAMKEDLDPEDAGAAAGAAGGAEAYEVEIWLKLTAGSLDKV